MTDKALEAIDCIGCEGRPTAPNNPCALCGRLAASPSPSEMEVEATAWEGYWPGAGSISSTTKLTKDKDTAARWQDDGAEITPLVTLSQAQSALAAMRALKDEAWNKGYAARNGVVDACRSRAEAAEARAVSAEQANKALMDERTSLIETKRQQIERLTQDRITAERDAQNMANQLVAAEARVKDAMGLLDHLVDWIVHDCGAEVPFSGEQDETYAALKGDPHD